MLKRDRLQRDGALRRVRLVSVWSHCLYIRCLSSNKVQLVLLYFNTISVKPAERYSQIVIESV